MNAQSHVAWSDDGVPIHYDILGNGTPALVFVHGWCCDRHYWDRQMSHFASHYTVVSLDLAGHGASGCDRTQWTIPAFGGDVVAVIEQLGLGRDVLIGHSMGGAVIIEAAHRLSSAVIGLVGVDTWQNLRHTWTPEQIAERLAPFRTGFAEATRSLVQTMFLPTSDAALVERIVTAMSATPPQIGTAVGEYLLAYDDVMLGKLREVKAPKIAINSAEYRVTDTPAAQRCGIEVVFMSGVGHFVMIEDPQTFNRLLDEALKGLVHPSGPQ